MKLVRQFAELSREQNSFEPILKIGQVIIQWETFFSANGIEETGDPHSEVRPFTPYTRIN